MKALVLAAFLAVLVSPTASGKEPRLNNLLVHGKGFIFGVKEPDGWLGETQGADRIAANVFFLRPKESISNAAALIRVRVIGKTDENVAADLRADMEGYQSGSPGIKFRDLRVEHPTYAVAAKLFFVPGKFYEYVVYVNPGSGKSLAFAVSMNKQKCEATSAELSTLRAVVSSLAMLSS